MNLIKLMNEIKHLSEIDLLDGESKQTAPLLDITKLRLVKVALDDYQVFHSTQEVEQAIKRLGEVTGWIQATSEVKVYNRATIELKSPLLNAELVDNQGCSYLIDYLDNGQWGMQCCQIYDCASHQNDATHLAERITHLQSLSIRNKESNKKGDTVLVYDKLWHYVCSPYATKGFNESLVADMAFFKGFDSQAKRQEKSKTNAELCQHASDTGTTP